MMSIADPLHAQEFSLEEYTMFSSRIINPVTVELKTEQQNIFLYADNKSYYQYNLKIRFDECGNLSPSVFEKETILATGKNRLFSFKIINPKEPPALSFETKYYMSKSNYGNERLRPYLVPIGQRQRVEFRSIDNGSSKNYYVNQFVMNSGDTIFNSRKGIVTAEPDDYAEVDRIANNNSLEIRHSDGTVAIYVGISVDSKMVSLGQTVYPGQPIGTMGSSELLSFSVVEIQDEGKVKNMDIFYAGSDDQLIPSNILLGTIGTFPDEVIKKEMTKKEVSKYIKKSLY